MTEPFMASIVTSMPGGGQIQPYISPNPPFSDVDVDQLALAMRTQGNWFMGRDCRTEEQSRKVARDLLILCDTMRYYKLYPLDDGPLVPGWVPPVPPNPATGVVAGAPGYFTPPGCDNPQTMQDLNYGLGAAGQTNPWPLGNWVDIGLPDNPDMATWIGPADQTANYLSWVQGPLNKASVKISQNFPPEPTVTNGDQANADKLQGLGYFPDGSGAWASWDNFFLGKWWFTWTGTKWAPGTL